MSMEEQFNVELEKFRSKKKEEKEYEKIFLEEIIKQFKNDKCPGCGAKLKVSYTYKSKHGKRCTIRCVCGVVINFWKDKGRFKKWKIDEVTNYSEC